MLRGGHDPELASAAARSSKASSKDCNARDEDRSVCANPMRRIPLPSVDYAVVRALLRDSSQVIVPKFAKHLRIPHDPCKVMHRRSNYDFDTCNFSL